MADYFDEVEEFNPDDVDHPSFERGQANRILQNPRYSREHESSLLEGVWEITVIWSPVYVISTYYQSVDFFIESQITRLYIYIIIRPLILRLQYTQAIEKILLI